MVKVGVRDRVCVRVREWVVGGYGDVCGWEGRNGVA